MGPSTPESLSGFAHTYTLRVYIQEMCCYTVLNLQNQCELSLVLNCLLLVMFDFTLWYQSLS